MSGLWNGQRRSSQRAAPSPADLSERTSAGGVVVGETFLLTFGVTDRIGAAAFVADEIFKLFWGIQDVLGGAHDWVA